MQDSADEKRQGLGDLGASLPASFDEAFVGYNATYSGDWKHVCNDVDGAATVLQGIDADAWNRSMRDAIWNRDKDQRDALLACPGCAPMPGARARQLHLQQLAPHAVSAVQGDGG